MNKNFKNYHDRFETIENNISSQQENINKLFKKTEINIKNKLLDTMINIPGIVEMIKELPNQLSLLEEVEKKLSYASSKLLEYEITLEETYNKVNQMEKIQKDLTEKIDNNDLKINDHADRIEQCE